LDLFRTSLLLNFRFDVVTFSKHQEGAPRIQRNNKQPF
jgi:hypothetical protein